jgi:hypothetical protein
MPNNARAWHIHQLAGKRTILNMPLHKKSVQMYWKIINMEMNLWELSIRPNILKRIYAAIIYSRDHLCCEWQLLLQKESGGRCWNCGFGLDTFKI